MTSVVATKGREALLIHSSGAEIACAGSNAYTAAQAGILDAGSARWLNVYGHVDGAAASGQVSLLVFGSNAAVKPQEDGRWYPVQVWDGTVTAAVLAAVPGVGSPAYTATPDWAKVLHRPINFITEPGDGASDEQPFGFSVNVQAWKWILVKYGQVDGGAAAKVLAYYSFSSG